MKERGVQQMAAVLRARIVQARLELAAAHSTDDAARMELNEQRLRYLTGAAAEYGITVGVPSPRLGGRSAARE